MLFFSFSKKVNKYKKKNLKNNLKKSNQSEKRFKAERMERVSEKVGRQGGGVICLFDQLNELE